MTYDEECERIRALAKVCREVGIAQLQCGDLSFILGQDPSVAAMPDKDEDASPRFDTSLLYGAVPDNFDRR